MPLLIEAGKLGGWLGNQPYISAAQMTENVNEFVSITPE
tara:strand:+ start:596 stop:712 length:117 start_codon:yes stop_codon:yes gene_type:complete